MHFIRQYDIWCCCGRVPKQSIHISTCENEIKLHKCSINFEIVFFIVSRFKKLNCIRSLRILSTIAHHSATTDTIVSFYITVFSPVLRFCSIFITSFMKMVNKEFIRENLVLSQSCSKSCFSNSPYNILCEAWL